MSYDVYLEADTGGEPAEVFWRNHTSNTAPMWREAGVDIADWHGQPATAFGDVLTPAVEYMERHPDQMQKFNAPNGWGDYDSTLAFLTDLRDACKRYPKTTVRVSR